MAKPLVFQWGDQQLSFEMTKVDRSRLYGFKEVEVMDDRGDRCELATLAQDGHTVIRKGGTAFCQLTVDNAWITKAELTPVDAAGQKMLPVPSSFAAPVPLSDNASVEDLLDCVVRAVYQMAGLQNGGGDLQPLLAELRGGKIYRFPYSYRGGLEPDIGYLMSNAEGEVFCLIGRQSKVEFLSLAQTASALDEEAEPTEEEDGDPMDFSMM